MGMDVHGIKNKDAYFRANVWSWRPIHSIITEVASDFIPPDVLRSMCFNEGGGLKSDEDCKKLASRIQLWMEHNTDGHTLPKGSNSSDNEFMAAIDSFFKGMGPDVKVDKGGLDPVYSVDDEHLKEFVEFLNTCGGFEVW